MKKLALKPPVPLRPNSKILDIGSGNNPLDIATHLLDLIPDSDRERGGQIEIPKDKIFSEGSIEKIPFADQFFDFVHAAHVLEHADSIPNAISEMMRVAPAGYIETPQAVSEMGVLNVDGSKGWHFHRWLVWGFKDQKMLYLKAKDAVSDESTCRCRWSQDFKRIMAIAPYQNIDAHLPYSARMTQLNWVKTIRFEIWASDQIGKTEGLRCNCMFAAFAERVTDYFRDIFQIRRRMRLKKAYPEIHSIFMSWEATWPK